MHPEWRHFVGCSGRASHLATRLGAEWHLAEALVTIVNVDAAIQVEALNLTDRRTPYILLDLAFCDAGLGAALRELDDPTPGCGHAVLANLGREVLVGCAVLVQVV